jgi:anhydro-N-acetylmuramic acid kinase
MSGTSLDGLDIAACEFTRDNNCWNFNILRAETISYSDDWTTRLSNASELDGEKLTELDRDYGNLLGNLAGKFIQYHRLSPLLVASHGHTVFHRPDKGYSLQVGHGANIAVRVGKPVVSDFRSADVALCGQGAPLVPAGDQLLFPSFSYRLNLGGFSNISYIDGALLRAGDICPVNYIANLLARKMGMPYDINGDAGRNGHINRPLLDTLNELDFYRLAMPRSLGREWVEENIYPLMEKFPDAPENLLRTWYEHIAIQIGAYLKGNGRVLVTGGGAFNRFLMERIKHLSEAEVIIPDDNLVKYKEAMIFALLGLLRWHNQTNCYRSVTGALRDSSSGAVYFP